MFDKAIFQLDRAVPSAMAIALLSVFYALSTVLLAYFLSQAIVGIWQGLPISDEIGNISCFALFFICRSVAACLQDLISERFANRNVSKLRHALFASIFSCGFGLIQAKGSAAMINDCKGGLEDVKVYLSQVFLRVIDLFSIPLALCLAIMGFDAISGCIVLVSFPLIIVFMRLIGMNAASEAERRYRGFARMSNYFLDAIRGMNAIRSFGRQKEYGKSVYRTSERYRKLTMKTIAIATLSSAVLDLFATLSLAAVAIMLGVRLIDGSIGFAPALATLILVPEFFRPIKRYASDYHASLNGRSALASIHGTIEDAKHLRSKHIGRMGSMRGASDLNISTSSTLKADNIAFSYGDGFDLRGISFKIPMNAKIAIVGSSGSGKTTLLNLLSGFSDPDSGEFEISGTRVATLGIDAWKKHVAYIPQEPYIFSMSLRANIAFYNRDATDEEILSAIEKVGLGGLLKDLPCGLDTIVGDGGVGMSGGQAQRVALARALLDKERFIWIFDEPTSHLDLETEYEIKQKMLVLMEDKFVLFATHRLHWLDQMDYAIKVDNGRADLVKLEKDAPSPIDVGRSFEDVS